MESSSTPCATLVARLLAETEETPQMVLKIERVSDGQLMILHLSGRLQSEHVDELKAQIEGCARRVILALGDVKLVDRDVVCFLGVCEENGVELRHCPLYIRDWIDRERAGQRDS